MIHALLLSIAGQAALVGRVSTADGAPVADAAVYLIEGKPAEIIGAELRNAEDFPVARTDANGQFVHHRPGRATTLLALSDAGFAVAWLYPNQTRSDLTIPLRPWSRVVGRLGADADLSLLFVPLAGPPRKRENRAPVRWLPVPVQAAGDRSFTLQQVRPGDSAVYWSSELFADSYDRALTRLYLRDGEETVLPTPEPAGAFRGRLRLSSRLGDAGYRAMLEPLWLMSVSSPQWNLQVQPDPAGRIALEDVTVGRYALDVPLIRNPSDDVLVGRAELTVRADRPADLGTLVVRSDRAVVPGQPAPPLEARTSAGAPFDLASHRGRPLLLMFWASWSPPTAEDRVLLQRLQDDAGDGLPIATVSVDRDTATAAAFLADHPPIGTPLHAPGRSTLTAWGIRRLPHTVLIDAAGRIVAENPSVRRLQAAASSTEPE